MSVVALWSPSDHLLSVLAPLALAASRSPSLVIDLDQDGPSYSAPFTLAELVEAGPTAKQIERAKSGTHVLANGGVDASDASEVIGALVDRWPNVVLRCPPARPAPTEAVSIVPLLPEPLCSPRSTRRTLFQDVGLRTNAPAGGVVLPRPKASTLAALSQLEVPVRSRWVNRLGSVWGTA